MLIGLFLKCKIFYCINTYIYIQKNSLADYFHKKKDLFVTIFYKLILTGRNIKIKFLGSNNNSIDYLHHFVVIPQL